MFSSRVPGRSGREWEAIAVSASIVLPSRKKKEKNQQKEKEEGKKGSLATAAKKERKECVFPKGGVGKASLIRPNVESYPLSQQPLLLENI